ncbi:MAG: hypothetical protein RL693_1388 [Verrucomicrobiota bacterium]|jgi:hypothetical protein
MSPIILPVNPEVDLVKDIGRWVLPAHDAELLIVPDWDILCVFKRRAPLWFDRGRLCKRFNRAQFKAVILTTLRNFGIRWQSFYGESDRFDLLFV